LRSRVWNNQRAGYNAMFHAVSQTLLKFGVDPKHLGAKIGFTAILHTHSRRLDYHPHIHVVIPGGGVNVEKNQWIRKSSKYLFNGRALAQVFRGKFLEQLIAQEFSIPTIDKKQWITNCKRVGHGEKALQYLSRYLYRGVISERNILTDQDGKVTFQYIDSNTKTTQTRTLPGEDFLWLIFQHILPKGFRRVRDYGLLHANSKLLIQQVQLIFQIKLKRKKEQGRPEVCCKICKQVMKLIAIMIKPATQIPPIQTIVTTGASP